ncbi:MAG: phosphatase PAP2 family protein [Deltaproteobacteria bacterium]|nr:phosphatase PAP2 family protein [Deltaproteobacteria bacterium]
MINPAVDAPVLIVSGIAALMPARLNSEIEGPGCNNACDPSDVNAFDRAVIGNDSAAARTASDVFLGAGTALPFALDLLDVAVSSPADGTYGLVTDTLVLAETVTVDMGITNVVKYTVRRQRPFTYDTGSTDAERADVDSSFSFWSAHTSTTFAMATAYSYLFMMRHPGSPLIAPCWILTELMAATTGVLRVVAGKHFYTDVIAGAVSGVAIGYFVPLVHTRGAGKFSTSVSWRLVPQAADGGAMLSLVIL